MPLGTEVGLAPVDIVSDGDPAALAKRGTAAPTFRPVSFVVKLSPISATELLFYKLTDSYFPLSVSGNSKNPDRA